MPSPCGIYDLNLEYSEEKKKKKPSNAHITSKEHSAILKIGWITSEKVLTPFFCQIGLLDLEGDKNVEPLNIR